VTEDSHDTDSDLCPREPGFREDTAKKGASQPDGGCPFKNVPNGGKASNDRPGGAHGVCASRPTALNVAQIQTLGEPHEYPAEGDGAEYVPDRCTKQKIDNFRHDSFLFLHYLPG
jgi:hypothetical protein